MIKNVQKNLRRGAVNGMQGAWADVTIALCTHVSIGSLYEVGHPNKKNALGYNKKMFECFKL